MITTMNCIKAVRKKPLKNDRGDKKKNRLKNILPTHLVEIGDISYDRRTVSEIKVREGVTEIGDETFNSCINLSSIKLPSTLLSILPSIQAYLSSPLSFPPPLQYGTFCLQS